MPIHNAKHTLSNTETTLIVDAESMPQQVHLHNMEKGNNKYIHIGNDEMTLNNSTHLDPGESVTLQIPAGDELYAMSDGNGLELGVVRIIQD